MRTAYGVDQLAPNDGTGKTIVIVDAFGSDTLADDLATFDSVLGHLRSRTSRVIAPYGNDEATPIRTTSPVGAVETSLDVEWAHAIAQGANIVLVVAKSDQDADILAATKYAIDNNLGDVISQSFGEAEQCIDPSLVSQQHAAFRKAVQKGITLFASSGDNGAGQPTCDAKPTDDPTPLFKAVSTPATDPNVTAVGGTTLIADPPTGTYQSEIDLERDRPARLSGLGRRRQERQVPRAALPAPRPAQRRPRGAGRVVQRRGAPRRDRRRSTAAPTASAARAPARRSGQRSPRSSTSWRSAARATSTRRSTRWSCSRAS